MSGKLILVETVSSFRITYVVKCREEEHALDEVLCNSEIVECSQRHIDENIFNTREITQEEYLKLFDKENDYMSSWTKEQKLNMINVINYDK
jgi:hypothetical protein